MLILRWSSWRPCQIQPSMERWTPKVCKMLVQAIKTRPTGHSSTRFRGSDTEGLASKPGCGLKMVRYRWDPCYRLAGSEQAALTKPISSQYSIAYLENSTNHSFLPPPCYGHRAERALALRMPGVDERRRHGRGNPQEDHGQRRRRPEPIFAPKPGFHPSGPGYGPRCGASNIRFKSPSDTLAPPPMVEGLGFKV